jgi:hypothetical protein
MLPHRKKPVALRVWQLSPLLSVPSLAIWEFAPEF